MRIVLAAIGSTAGLLSLGFLTNCMGQPGESPTFDIQVDGESNRVLVEPGHGPTRFDVYSDGGIGSA